VYRDLLDIPAFPLRPRLQMPTKQPVAEAILELSSSRNPRHDGFHLLTGEMELTHSCQYLAPPIDRAVRITESEYIGARYMTALFASKLPAIFATGIVSSDKIIRIFEHGTLVSKEDL
jgi:hypothetical protein